MKRFKFYFLGLLVFLVLFVTISIGFMMNGQKEIDAYQFDYIDLSHIEDGTYHGTYKNGRWSNSVSITIIDGTITNIEIKKTVLFERKEITASIIDEILTKQSLNIDMESGATITTKAYLKAIENAINDH